MSAAITASAASQPRFETKAIPSTFNPYRAAQTWAGAELAAGDFDAQTDAAWYSIRLNILRHCTLRDVPMIVAVSDDGQLGRILEQLVTYNQIGFFSQLLLSADPAKRSLAPFQAAIDLAISKGKFYFVAAGMLAGLRPSDPAFFLARFFAPLNFSNRLPLVARTPAERSLEDQFTSLRVGDCAWTNQLPAVDEELHLRALTSHVTELFTRVRALHSSGQLGPADQMQLYNQFNSFFLPFHAIAAMASALVNVQHE